MKRLATIFTLLIISFSAVYAQSYEGTVDYQRKSEQAIIISFPYRASIVEDAIVEKFEKMGFKKKESKGFFVYKNITLSDISPDPNDYMVRVDRKSRKEDDECLVYLVVYHGDQNVTTSDESISSNAKSFLNGLSLEVEAYSLESQIKDQDVIVTKAQKKLKNLQDDKDSMERKIRKLQDDLEQNAKDQDNQQKEIDKQTQILETLRGKRKTNP